MTSTPRNTETPDPYGYAIATVATLETLTATIRAACAAGGTGRALAELDALTTARELLDAWTVAAVDHARLDPANTWTRVGQVLGVTRQAAQQRYGKAPTRAPGQGDPALPFTVNDALTP